jgi:hypothetical protein
VRDMRAIKVEQLAAPISKWMESVGRFVGNVGRFVGIFA